MTNQPDKVDNCALILWGDAFDEMLAVTFATALRAAGFQVKIVGLRYHCITGAYGVNIFPDISLDEALTQSARIRCLVLPCEKTILQRVLYEPRLPHLFERASRQQANLVISVTDIADLIAIDLPIARFRQIIFLRQGEAAGSFANRVVKILLNPP